MHKNKSFSSLSIVFTITDLLLLTVIFFVLIFVRYQWELTPENFRILIGAHYKANLLLIIFWLFSANYFALYRNTRFDSLPTIFKKILFHSFIFSIALFAISGLKKEDLFPLNLSLIFLGSMLAYLLLSRLVVHFVLKYYRKRGYNVRNLVIVGYNENAADLVKLIDQRKDFGFKVLKIFGWHSSEDFKLKELEDYLSQNQIDFGYICLGNGFDEDTMGEITNILEKNYVHIGFIPNNALEIRQSLEVNYLDSFPVLTYKRNPLDNPFNQISKRIFDLSFTLIIFVVLLWWLLPILSIAVFFSQGRPIFYAQKRNGLNGKEFDCLKFRTMRPDKSNDKKPTERDDPRVTKLGRILRKTSLDELPQFFNVLKGDMSIVGPRPHMVSENESYSEIIKKYSLRHYVKPGITGLAQIRGYRGAIDSEKDMELRVRTDIYYVRNWSFLLDLLIIYKTVRLILVGDENAI